MNLNFLCLCSIFVATKPTKGPGKRSRQLAQVALGDFLVFLHRVASSHSVRTQMATEEWTTILLAISGHKPGSNLPRVDNLRTRLLALHLLEAVLPACHPEPGSNLKYKVRRMNV